MGRSASRRLLRHNRRFRRLWLARVVSVAIVLAVRMLLSTGRLDANDERE